MDYEVFKVSTDVADAWIIGMKGDYDYVYGGTRRVSSNASDTEVEEDLFRLMAYESHLKNSLINKAVTGGAIGDLEGKVPAGFMEARVGGGRCVFRTKNKSLDKTLAEPSNEHFESAIKVLFKDVGDFLNKVGGRIKITPDFGKFAGSSDILYEFTPHVLGIQCEEGGCGGKSSYTSTGIIAALEIFDIHSYHNKPVTLIGADGALGSDISQFFFKQGYNDVKVCDLEYKNNHIEVERLEGVKKKMEVLPSKPGQFTTPCLDRGGAIVATTVGKELENSEWTKLPEDTLLVLAHNLALPSGEEGNNLVKKLEAAGIRVIPGQLLTLGGALTSRLEWFSRTNQPQDQFNKALAHKVVKNVVTFLLTEVNNKHGGTFYEKMCNYAEFNINT